MSVKQRLLGVVLVFGGAGLARGGYIYSDYEWYDYNDHQYAITLDYNPWVDAEAEAQAVGGHLVTVNDAAENVWLSDAFQGYYTRDDPGWTWSSFVWIGLYQTQFESQPYQPGGEWFWASGEPVDYVAPIWHGDWFDPGVNHAYLHTASHPDPGTWLNGSWSDTPPGANPRGIIELDRSVPEPATFIIAAIGLLSLTFLLLRRRRRLA